MRKFKQAIQIGNKVTDIMKLPCVWCCRKNGCSELVYILYDFDERMDSIEAREGDWLCEDYDGRWHVFSSEEYGERKD